MGDIRNTQNAMYIPLTTLELALSIITSYSKYY